MPEPSIDVVDAHTHLLPATIGSRIREFFDRHMPAPLAYPLDPGRTRDRLLEAGVRTLWTLPYAHRRGVADWLNPAMAELAAELDGPQLRVVGGLTVHPDDERPAEVVAAGVDAGLRVVKLHCSVGDFDVSDARLTPVWDAAVELGLPVVVHLGHGISGHSDEREVLRLESVAAAHGDLRVVVAHAGHPATRATASLMHRFPSVHADLTPVVTEPVDVSEGVFDGLEHRLMFGTDAPNTALDAADQVTRVRSLFDEDAARHILAATARRLVPEVSGAP